MFVLTGVIRSRGFASLMEFDGSVYEQALIGYMALLSVEDALLIGKNVKSVWFSWPLHRALFIRLTVPVNNGYSLLERQGASGVERWLEGPYGKGNIVPRRYLACCMQSAAEDAAEAMFCVQMIEEYHNRRERLRAARQVVEYALNEDMSLEDIDRNTDRILRQARK